MSLHQLIYVSSATEPLQDAELGRILESSVRHNTVQEVTGMLLYSDGNFMQVLEGEEAEVNETYHRLCQDIRHHNIILLYSKSIEQREFSAWSMGFHRISRQDADTHSVYAPYLVNGFNVEKIAAEPGLATEILKQFCKDQDQ